MAVVTHPDKWIWAIPPLIFNRILPPTPSVRRKLVIVGAGKQPRLLAQRVTAHGEEVVVLDRDPARRAAVEAIGVPFVQGDATEFADSSQPWFT